MTEPQETTLFNAVPVVEPGTLIKIQTLKAKFVDQIEKLDEVPCEGDVTVVGYIRSHGSILITIGERLAQVHVSDWSRALLVGVTTDDWGATHVAVQEEINAYPQLFTS